MNFSFNLDLSVIIGVLIIYLGFLIWKKEKISLIHSYHYQKVREEDKKAYTAIMGKAICFIGLGIILAGITDSIIEAGGIIWFIIFFTYGFVLINKAQKQYNNGWF